jgi:hypothetical protein
VNDPGKIRTQLRRRAVREPRAARRGRRRIDDAPQGERNRSPSTPRADRAARDRSATVLARGRHENISRACRSVARAVAGPGDPR